MRNTICFLFCIFFLCLFGNTAQGRQVPAYPSYFKIQLADGDSVYVKLVGDENAHWLETENGQIIIQDYTGAYIYANDLVTRQMRDKYNPRLHKSYKRQNSIYKSNKYVGDKHTLVLLLNFSDIKMLKSNSREEYYDMFNKHNYNNNNHVGSVRDYFRDQSYQQLTIDFDVIGPIELSRPHSYYGENSTYGDSHPREMVEEAINIIKDTIDFSKYDWDGDGEVEQIITIYAGYGEHSKAPSSTIWPHASYLSSGKDMGDGTGAMVLNNTIVDTYITMSELIGNKEYNLSGIGPICHEFCHTLGLPDFYDTSNEGNFGMKRWDIMDVGNYSGPNNRGEIPSGLTSYERWKLGWLTPTELSTPQTIIDMKCIGDSPEAYIIYNQGNENEYFLLENRSPHSKWFQYLGKNKALDNSIEGLLIIHVDYDQEIWEYNAINTEQKHQRMSIVPASNDFGTFNNGKWSIPAAKYKGHLYPYNRTNKLTATSSPSSLLFNTNKDGSPYLQTPITNITLHSNNTISFDFNNISTIAPPLIQSITHNSDSSYTFIWSSVDNAIGYNIEVTTNSAAPYLDTQTINNISSTQYSMFLNSQNYKFRIQSIDSDSIDGIWSNYMNLSELTAIEQPNIKTGETPTDMKYSINGIIHSRLSPSRLYINKNKRKLTVSKNGH